MLAEMQDSALNFTFLYQFPETTVNKGSFFATLEHLAENHLQLLSQLLKCRRLLEKF